MLVIKALLVMPCYTICLAELEGSWKDEKGVEKAMNEVSKLWKGWKIKQSQ